VCNDADIEPVPRRQRRRRRGHEHAVRIVAGIVGEEPGLVQVVGTGAIGLEALSRNAEQVVFIESDREAAQLIRRNAALCGVTSGYRVLEADVFTSLRTLAREGFTADIAFLDPPYWGLST
jgi:hypothetical protein